MVQLCNKHILFKIKQFKLKDQFIISTLKALEKIQVSLPFGEVARIIHRPPLTCVFNENKYPFGLI